MNDLVMCTMEEPGTRTCVPDIPMSFLLLSGNSCQGWFGVHPFSRLKVRFQNTGLSGEQIAQPESIIVPVSLGLRACTRDGKIALGEPESMDHRGPAGDRARDRCAVHWTEPGG